MPPANRLRNRTTKQVNRRADRRELSALPLYYRDYKDIELYTTTFLWIFSMIYSLATLRLLKPTGEWFSDKFPYAAKMHLLPKVRRALSKNVHSRPANVALVPILRQNAGVILVILNTVHVQLLLLEISIQSSYHSPHTRGSNSIRMNSRNLQTMQRISLLGSGGRIRVQRFPKSGWLFHCETFFEDYWSQFINLYDNLIKRRSNAFRSGTSTRCVNSSRNKSPRTRFFAWCLTQSTYDR